MIRKKLERIKRVLVLHPKKNVRLSVVIFGILLSLLFGVSAWAEFLPGQPRLVHNEEYASGRVLVRFKTQITTAAVNEALSSVNGTNVRSYQTPGLKLVELNAVSNVNQAITSLKNNPDVLYAESDYKVTMAATTPNDPERNSVKILTAADNGQVIEIKPFEVFKLVLLNPGSGGYIVKNVHVFDPQILTLVKTETKAPEATNMDGDFGKIIWTFKTQKEGRSRFRVTAARPWEENKPPIVIFEAILQITDQC